MANWELLENIEGDLESKEKEANENKEDLEKIDQRIANIESALGKLEGDEEVDNAVSEKKKEAETEKKSAEKKREELLKNVEGLENSLGELEEKNSRSQKQIEQLIGLGEEMDDAVAVIDERAGKIASAQNKLKQLRSELEKKLP